jgi:two-component system, chemotaxis family, sensor histidine kinase and response regulator PixL
MVVEDSAPFRQMLSVTLQGAGYQVSEAGDGVEAIAKLQQDKVDLIISDIEMPRMTGFELLTRLRLEPSLASYCTPINYDVKSYTPICQTSIHPSGCTRM